MWRKRFWMIPVYLRLIPIHPIPNLSPNHPKVRPIGHPDFSQFNGGIFQKNIVVVVVIPNFQQLSQLIPNASRETLWKATLGEASRLPSFSYPESKNDPIQTSHFLPTGDSTHQTHQPSSTHDFIVRSGHPPPRLVPSTSPCFDGCTACRATNLPARRTADARRRWSWRRRPWESRPGHWWFVVNVCVCRSHSVCVCALCNTKKCMQIV